MTSSNPDVIRRLTLENLLRFKRDFKPTLALKIARLLVGLEYGFFAASIVKVLYEMGIDAAMTIGFLFLVIAVPFY